MKFSCKLLNSDSYIRQNILQILATNVNDVLKKSIVPIESQIKILIKDSLFNQPEYLSLINNAGDLRLNFGIPDVSVVDRAISTFAGSSSFNYKPVKISTVGLVGGFTLQFIPQSSVEAASAESAVITNKGQSLPWLSWLLYEGTSPIVRDYDIQFGPNPYSRTGGAIMVPSKKNWRVPPAYAGTISNNWITRAIEDKDNDIYKIIENTIRANI